VLALLAELRRRGVSAETDYAGRSAKGRATHAERLGAEVRLFAGPETVTVRRAGEADSTLAYEEVADALA
jgi:histidyl-tRNA synthetase